MDKLNVLKDLEVLIDRNKDSKKLDKLMPTLEYLRGGDCLDFFVVVSILSIEKKVNEIIKKLNEK